MRLTVRLDEVRAPSAPNDALAAAVVEAADQASTQLADHYNAVLTQVRNALGTATWRDLPPASIASLSTAQQTTARNVFTQNQAIANLAQQVNAQAQALSALQAASNSVLAAQALIASLQRTVANVANTAAAQADLTALASQVAAVSTSLGSDLATLRLQIGNLAGQMSSDESRISVLEGQATSFITASGLKTALAQAFLFGQPLGGAQDGQNLVFTAETDFYPGTLTVYYNGQALMQSLGGDYIVETAGVSLTSNTIRLLHAEAAPHAQDVLTASYMPA